jgi:hypothetical protein
MSNANQYIIGVTLAYLYIDFMFGREKENPTINITLYPIFYNGMVIIPYYDKGCHIHHWMLSLPILFLYNYIPLYIWVFFLVLMMHGLSYNDSFEIMTFNPYK